MCWPSFVHPSFSGDTYLRVISHANIHHRCRGFAYFFMCKIIPRWHSTFRNSTVQGKILEMFAVVVLLCACMSSTTQAASVVNTKWIGINLGCNGLQVRYLLGICCLCLFEISLNPQESPSPIPQLLSNTRVLACEKINETPGSQPSVVAIPCRGNLHTNVGTIGPWHRSIDVHAFIF